MIETGNLLYTREQIQSILEQNKKPKKKNTESSNFSFFDIESYITELVNKMKPKDGTDGKDAIAPVKGQDYFTPQEIDELGVKLKSYIDANLPKKGVHYFDGKDGRDGKTIMPLHGKDGKDGTSVTIEDLKGLIPKIPDIMQKQEVLDLLDEQHKSHMKSLKQLENTVLLNYGGHGGSGGSGSATQRDVFTATEQQTVFTASKTVKSDIQVSESGTILTPTTDYTNTTTTLTLIVGVPAGTVVIWYYNV